MEPLGVKDIDVGGEAGAQRSPALQVQRGGGGGGHAVDGLGQGQHPVLRHVLLDGPDEGAVQPGVGAAGGGIGAVGDHRHGGGAENGGDVLLRGDEVHHGDVAALGDEQVEGAVGLGFALDGGDFRHGFADEGLVFRLLERGEVDILPAHEGDDIVIVLRRLEPLLHMVPAGRVRQTAADGLRPALQHLRRQHVEQLGGTGGVGVHVPAYVQATAAGIFQH